MRRPTIPGRLTVAGIAFIAVTLLAFTPSSVDPRNPESRSERAIEASSASSDSPAAAVSTLAGQTTSSVGAIVIGESVERRDIVAMRFGTGARKVLIVGGVHGDEYGVDVAEAFVEALQEHPGLVAKNTQIHVIECLNPDGRAAGLRGNARGVDLNLNMPAANWKHTLDRRTTARKRGLNGGRGPGSEPESKALIAYLDEGFDLVISLHSAGGIVDWDGPGGEAIARRMATRVAMKAEHLPVQPYATGTMGQYIPEKWAIPVITVELSSRNLGQPLLDAVLSAAADDGNEP